SWEYRPGAFSFGSFDDMVKNLERRLAEHPYIAGDTFTAADTQFGSGIHFVMNILKVLPERPVFQDYLARVSERPAFGRYMAKDADLIHKVTPIAF
ncbi:glutathione S-transferase family protein, partial [Rhizobiaceae sp. 2RAB30]